MYEKFYDSPHAFLHALQIYSSLVPGSIHLAVLEGYASRESMERNAPSSFFIAKSVCEWLAASRTFQSFPTKEEERQCLKRLMNGSPRMSLMS